MTRATFPLVDVLIGVPAHGAVLGSPALLTDGISLDLFTDQACTTPAACLDMVGNPITSVVVDGVTIPRFQGPDAAVVVYARANISPVPTAFPMLPTDVTAVAASITSDADRAVAARIAAEAVPTTTDTLIAGRINDAASAARAALDTKYLPLSGMTHTSDANGHYFTKVSGDGRDSALNFINDDTTGYVMHFTPGPNWSGTSIIGIGTNVASTTGNAVILSNKGSGTHGLRLINQPTVTTGNGIYGTHQGGGVFVFLESASGAAGALVSLSDASGALATAAKPIQAWGDQTGTVAEIMAADGTSRWRRNANAWISSGTAPRFVAASASAALATAHQAQLGGDIQGLQIYRYSGSSGSWYASRISSDATRTLTISMGYAAAAQGSEVYTTVAQYKVASATNPQAGFLGAAPRSRSTIAAATGTATRTTFDTATVTLSQLAERVKALIDDFGATSGFGFLAA
jgi:hypothetical protein